ncbi:MAG: hypothetical protein KA165_14750, partial [Saprospiraceae bacterium]|nr:hypothetical protein [Saprospiraceae bacterium]
MLQKTKIIFPAAFLALISTVVSAQNYTQTLKGTVQDKVVKTPLAGATVVVLDAEPVIGGTTD